MKTITIGRSQDNDIVLEELKISRHHCQLIQYDDGRVAICDNGSTNGTYVNGEKIIGRRFLKLSDSVILGGSSFPWTSYMQPTSNSENHHNTRTVFINDNDYHNHSNQHREQNPYINNVININNNNAIDQSKNNCNDTGSDYSAPAIKLRTNRSLLKYFFLSIFTFGIYGIVVMSHISSEINYIATKHDGRHTTHYCLVIFLLTWITLGIYDLVWYTKICSRMGNELIRRKIPYDFGAGHYWGWYILGSIILIGPLVFYHEFFNAMNKLCEDYNKRG